MASATTTSILCDCVCLAIRQPPWCLARDRATDRKPDVRVRIRQKILAIERTLLDLRKRFLLCKVLYDPYQMQATAQRLTRAGVQLEEFPQSPANLTMISQNLFELIRIVASKSSGSSGLG